MNNKMVISVIVFALLTAAYSPKKALTANQTATGDHITNSVGMKMVRVKAGEFVMGTADDKISDGTDIDERPAHKVAVSNAFYMGVTEVTNAQFEQFRPGFRKSSGKPNKLSNGDDDAVIFVSWHDAVDFCKWLSNKEGAIYRLPTEAEWEYACRAASTTDYHQGFKPPKKQKRKKKDAPAVSLEVAQAAPNVWGLYDMHGNVEEWCLDWYGPYEKGAKVDPVGRIDGEFRVTRGGSHSTRARYLRSANRSGALPQDKHQLIGFRAVMGPIPKTKPLPKSEPKACMASVSQKIFDWKAGIIDMSKPYFKGPVRYVKQPANPIEVPMFKHNHCPAITYCDNGDLLAVWFSCINESGREMTILTSRLRAGSDSWDEPSEFYNVPDRNMTGSSLINDNQGVLYYFNGVSIGSGYKTNNALIMKTSADSGATWSQARLINPKRGISSQPIGSAYCSDDGRLVVPSDWPWARKNGATALWISSDRGNAWSISPTPIAGIHAGVVDLGKESFLALGRFKGKADSTMPMSISNDGGNNWAYSQTQFQGIGGGQRLVLRKLQQGPLLLISFTGTRKNQLSMTIRDKAGKERAVYGMFAALSFDQGKSWPVKKLVTAGGPAREFDGGAWTRKFMMDDNHAEHAGYLAGIQTPDGMFHLISSALHYQFNLVWLEQPMPPAKP